MRSPAIRRDFSAGGCRDRSKQPNPVSAAREGSQFLTERSDHETSMQPLGETRKASAMNVRGDGWPATIYDFREEGGTWTVYDCQSGCPAILNGVSQVGLGLNEASDLAAVLNRVEIELEAARMANEPWEWTPPRPAAGGLRTPRE
jgi:hypothetical protein